MTMSLTTDTRRRLTVLLVDAVNNSPARNWTEAGFETVEAQLADANNIMLKLRRRGQHPVILNVKISQPYT